MKKVIILIFILIFLISSVSAFSIKDFLTGKTIEQECEEGWVCDQGAFPLYHNSHRYYRLGNCDMRTGSSEKCFYGCLGTECAPSTNLCGNNICDVNPATYKIGDIEEDCPEDCATDCWGCVDSDGKNYYEKGKVTFIKKPYPSALNGKDDQCRDSQIEEWYCENGCPKKELYDCPSGCLNDACFSAIECGDAICEGTETYETCSEDCEDTSNLDLANYPSPFIVNGNSNKIAIVLGDDSPSLDVIASNYISLSLQQIVGVGYEAANMLVSEINNPEQYNLILVGHPCENSLIEDIGNEKCSDWNFEEGNAIIKLVPNGENVALVVVGTEGEDRRRAASFISNYKDNELEGNKIILDTISDDVEIKTELTVSKKIPEIEDKTIQEMEIVEEEPKRNFIQRIFDRIFDLFK